MKTKCKRFLKHIWNPMVFAVTLLIAISYTGALAGYKANALMATCLCIAFAIGFFTKSIRFQSRYDFSRIWLLYFVFVCISSFFNLPRSLLYTVVLLAGILIMTRKTTADEISILVRFFKVVTLILAASIFVQAYLPDIFYPIAKHWHYYSNQLNMLCNLAYNSSQYAGLFYEVSQAGFTLSIGAVVFFTEFAFLKKKRILNLVLAGSSYWAIVLTGKRSMMLMVLAVFGIVFLASLMLKPEPWKLIVTAVAVLVFLTQISTVSELINRVLTKGGDKVALSGREKFWALAMDMFRDSPFVGKGINSYDIYFNASGIRDIQYDFAGAHNSYLQILAETGVVGFILYFGALIHTLVLGVQGLIASYKKKSDTVFAYGVMAFGGILFILLYALSGNPLYLPQQVIMMFLLLSMLTNLRHAEDTDFTVKNKMRNRFLTWHDDEIAVNREKTVYILKKGLQCYPPCLAQVLHLHDLGTDMVVYHGKNSEYINAILDERGIEHHTLHADKDSTKAWQSYFGFVSYTFAIRKILRKLKGDPVIWYGNCESAMTIGKTVCKRRYVLSVLELYEEDSLYGKLVGKIIPSADEVICCEKHRAVIMKDRYHLQTIPHIIPNKPYMLADDSAKENEKITALTAKYKDKKFILYQGIIQKDRPIGEVAEALAAIGNDDFVLVAMGKHNESYEKEIKEIYKQTECIGYIPAPEHLAMTKLAHIGIAIYDNSSLNNQFCAPNKIYEYGAFGVPMITSENLGLTETVGLYGAAECVDFTDIAAIQNAILKIDGDYSTYSANAVAFYNGVDCRQKIAAVKENAGI